MIYVARGNLQEKNGRIEASESIPSIKIKKGSIACLQNLIPWSEQDGEPKSISDVSNSDLVEVEFLNLPFLREILRKDKVKLLKLWKVLASRLIVLNFSKFDLLKEIIQSNDRIKIFCKMCDLQIYQPGDIILVQNGGILFRGNLKKLH